MCRDIAVNATTPSFTTPQSNHCSVTAAEDSVGPFRINICCKDRFRLAAKPQWPHRNSYETESLLIPGITLLRTRSFKTMLSGFRHGRPTQPLPNRDLSDPLRYLRSLSQWWIGPGRTPCVQITICETSAEQPADAIRNSQLLAMRLLYWERAPRPRTRSAFGNSVTIWPPFVVCKNCQSF